MLLYYFLILVILQYVDPRVYNPVKQWTGGFLETFSQSGKIYEDLPWNQTFGDGLNWTIRQQSAKYYSGVKLYCPRPSNEVCALLDDYGNIAGVQFSVPSGHLKTVNMPNEQSKYFQKKTIEGKSYATLNAYFVLQRTLRKGGRQRQIKYLGIGLWYPFGHQTVTIPLKEEDLTEQGWKKQSCAKYKGTYYMLVSTKEIASSCFLPYVPTTHEGIVSGLTFLTPGFCPNPLKKGEKGRKTNFISLDEKDVKELFPTAPACLVEMARTRGLCSAHFGFVATPPNQVRCSSTSLVETIIDETKTVLDKGIGFLQKKLF